MKIPGWMRNRIQMPPSARRDALLIPALFILNGFFFAAFNELAQAGAKPWLILVWLYGLAMLIPLAWRDRAPVAVFASQCVLTVAAWPFMALYTPVVGVPAALHAVSVHRSKKISLLALLTSIIPLGLATATLGFRTYADQPPATQLQVFVTNTIMLIIVTVGAWAGGRVTRTTHQHLQRLERERETVREAVAAERGRIARELHDIVSHAVTAIVLQAAGAARVASKNFAQVTQSQVTQSLANIETTGKQAMAELRRLLGVLEATDPGSYAAGAGELGPQPGLADLTLVLTSVRDAGLPVTVHVEGTPRNLDPSIDLAAYRTVQEGLTNVLKHAGVKSNPRLKLVWEPHSLVIQIDNDIDLAQARRGQALSVGRGLAGLRARAHAAGGRVHAGPHPNGGYRLTATLPLGGVEQNSSTTANRFNEGHGGQGKVSA